MDNRLPLSPKATNAPQMILEDNIVSRILSNIIDADAESKSKHEINMALIEKATDMSTAEKISVNNANYALRTQEHWKNLLIVAVFLYVITQLPNKSHS